MATPCEIIGSIVLNITGWMLDAAWMLGCSSELQQANMSSKIANRRRIRVSKREFGNPAVQLRWTRGFASPLLNGFAVSIRL